MNRCFDNNERFDSNNRISAGSLRERRPVFGERISRGLRAADRALLILVSHLGARTCSILRALSLVFCLIVFVGIIGAMERGTLGFGRGMLLGGILLALEYLCLRPSRDKVKKQDAEEA